MNQRIKPAVWVLGALLITLLLSVAGFAQGKLMVYSILQQNFAEEMLREFTKETGIAADFVRGSGGEIVARVIAESGAPRADVVLGGASNLHESMKEAGALRPYLSPVAAEIPAQYRDSENYWSGFYLTALGIGVNKSRYNRLYKDKPLPQTWDDLTDPAFRGELIVTDPVASSTAYLFLNTILQERGWEAGWDYLDRLHRNVAQWPTSGSAPPRMVGTGEYALAVSFAHSFLAVTEQGYDLELILPPRTGGDVGSVSIIAGGPNPEAAEKFVDWVLSKEAQKLHADMSLTSPTHPEVPTPAGVVPLDELDFINYDPLWAGENRDRILNEWDSRY